MALLALVLCVAACSSGGEKQSTPTTAHPARSPVVSTTSVPVVLASSAPPPTRCPTEKRTYTYAQLAALQPAVDGMVKGNFAGVGTGEHTIMVNLFPGREALAAKIETRFGNAVAITVGSTPYHCGDGNSAKCPPIQGNSNLPPGLHLTLKLGVASMPATGSINAQLVVQEDSATPLSMDTGSPLVADIVRPGTRTVVATYGGGIGGVGFGFKLRDGEQVKVTRVVAAWRCDGRPGSTLPPGTYGVRVGISRNERVVEYLAPEVPLTIARRANASGNSEPIRQATLPEQVATGAAAQQRLEPGGTDSARSASYLPGDETVQCSRDVRGNARPLCQCLFARGLEAVGPDDGRDRKIDYDDRRSDYVNLDACRTDTALRRKPRVWTGPRSSPRPARGPLRRLRNPHQRDHLLGHRRDPRPVYPDVLRRRAANRPLRRSHLVRRFSQPPERSRLAHADRQIGRASSVPDALRLTLDGQRGIEVERRRTRKPEHHDAALVWRRDQSVVTPPGEWPTPLFPSEARVERGPVRHKASDLVVTDRLSEALHGGAAVALFLAQRQSRDCVDKRGTQDRESFGLDSARRDDRVAHECVAVVREEMARA